MNYQLSDDFILVVFEESEVLESEVLESEFLLLSEVEESAFLLFLKSVSYQPVPLSLKDEAETNFVSAGLPHSGQSFNGSSLIF